MARDKGAVLGIAFLILVVMSGAAYYFQIKVSSLLADETSRHNRELQLVDDTAKTTIKVCEDGKKVCEIKRDSALMDLQTEFDKTAELRGQAVTCNADVAAKAAELDTVKSQLQEKEQARRDAGYGEGIPTIYVITPTYTRLVQKAAITGLKQTLQQAGNLHWVVVEDAAAPTELVTNLLKDSGLTFTHLAQQGQSVKQSSQRNAGLDWIRANVPHDTKGVLCFADDDNTYDLKIFQQMRQTQRISVWPVGFVGQLTYEGPVVTDGHVVGWRAQSDAQRVFPVDMAGFALNLNKVFEFSDVKFNLSANITVVESELLQGFSKGMDLKDLEPLADGCTKVLVWHTGTSTPDTRLEGKLKIDDQVKLEI